MKRIMTLCAVLLVVFLIKYTKNPKPIEGVDYFTEIPLYRFKRKAADANKAEEKLLAAAERAETAGSTKKAAALREKAAVQTALYEKNARLAEEDAAKREAKKRTKADR